MAARRSCAFYKLGSGLSVPMTLHKNNRHRLCDRMKQIKSVKAKSFILLQGGAEVFIGGSDSANVFRQESFFHWSFGVLDPGFFGVIDIDNETTSLFMPRLDETYAIFMGQLETNDEVKIKYAVENVCYVDEIHSFLERVNPSEIHTLYGLNSDSGLHTKEATFAGINDFVVNNKVLHREIVECRVIKSEEELEVLRYANKMSSNAHRDVMKKVRPGMYEYQVESTFAYNCYFHGAMRNLAYTAIGATGCNCAVLHYGHAGAPNDRIIEDGAMCLFDIGGEYYCYTSDITCSYPVNGRFTADQKKIYEAVLAANRAVMDASRPGVSWLDMHKLAEKTILTHLKQHGLLRGDVSEMMDALLGGYFMPHGLGHFMGVDVHDVGGYLGDALPRSEELGLKSLRTTRTLQKNMVITVEPGCYFVDFLLDEALSNASLAKFLVPEEIARFRKFGGVRIEDNVVVTDTGVELLTDVPRTCQEIEQWMAA